MTEFFGKYYYENLLANQNQTAKTNVVWTADITTLKLYAGEKAYVFLCLDIHTNMIVASAISTKTITSPIVVKSLENAIKERFKVTPINKLIIHTDRGTQFSSKAYKNFIAKYEEYFLPSMARENTPTDNAVAERFMRTFKDHLIYDITIEQEISDLMLQSLLASQRFNSYRACLNKYVTSLNRTPNKKAIFGPEQRDKRITAATMLMREPNHPKATSNLDLRLPEVEHYKSESNKVATILEEYAARKSELVNQTPFDLFENNLAIEIIDKRLEELSNIIKSNPNITRAYVQEAITPVEDSLTELHTKIDTLLVRARKDREVLPLRDPIDINLFPLFFTNAGSQALRKKDLKQAQLRIGYCLLYHTGVRINEIREITLIDINNAIATSQLSIIHHKTKQPHIHVLSKIATLKFKQLKPEIDIVFNKYQYQFLFGKNRPMHKKTFITLINQDLKHTCETNEIGFNIKSHSFRINMISSLLKVTSVQHAAQIIGHKDIQSTMSYQRYALSKKEIQHLLEDIQKVQDIHES